MPYQWKNDCAREELNIGIQIWRKIVSVEESFDRAEEAMLHLEKALNLEPETKDPSIYMALADVYVSLADHLKNVNEEKKKEFAAKALKMGVEALKLDKNELTRNDLYIAYRSVGMSFLLLGGYGINLAIRFFTLCLEKCGYSKEMEGMITFSKNKLFENYPEIDITLDGFGHANMVSEKPPVCVMEVPLNRYLPNLIDFYQPAILAITFDSGPPENPTARSYVYYFYKDKPEEHRQPDDILTFKVRFDDPSKVDMVDKYLGGMAFGPKNAPPLADRHLWQPGWMTNEGKAESAQYIGEQFKKYGRESDAEIALKLMEDEPTAREDIPEILQRDINVPNITEYLNWRLPDREQGSIEDVAELSVELRDYGYVKLNQVDEAILRSYDAVMAHEGKYFLKDTVNYGDYLGQIGVVRTALEFTNDDYLKKRTEGYGSRAWRIRIEEFRHLVNETGRHSVIKPLIKPEKPKLQKSGCFIATAAFGTPLAKEVLLLTEFRDEFLSQYFIGRKFIRLYYDFSPRVASYIDTKEGLRLLLRNFLISPLVAGVKFIKSL